MNAGTSRLVGSRVFAATCGNRLSRRTCGSTAAICISRHYSLYLALQLKAGYEDLPTPVYGLQEVHHLS
jgi:hypothetical protein